MNRNGEGARFDTIAFNLPAGDHHRVKAFDIGTWPRAIGVALDLEHAAVAYCQPREILVVDAGSEAHVVSVDT